MLQRGQIAGEFNEDLRLLHTQGKYLDLPPLPEEEVSHMVHEGVLPDREWYTPGEVIPPIMEYWVGKKGKRRRWSPVEARGQDRIFSLYFLGKSVPEIAAEVGCNQSTVRRRLGRRLVFAVGPVRFRATTIRALRGEGWPIAELAEEFGITRRQVHRILATKD